MSSINVHVRYGNDSLTARGKKQRKKKEGQNGRNITREQNTTRKTQCSPIATPVRMNIQQINSTWKRKI